MASKFNIVAELHLRGPKNLDQITKKIQKKLGGINANVNIKLDKRAQAQLRSIVKALREIATASKQASSAANNASSSINNTGRASQAASKHLQDAATGAAAFGKQSALAVKRFAAFSVGAGIMMGVANAIREGTRAAVDFERQMVKVSQVTGQTMSNLSGLGNQITNLSSTLGTSSKELIDVARIMSQTGLAARDVQKSMKALALSSLAPTFKDMANTAEGAIAIMRQFGVSADQLAGKLGSINALAGSFAVESQDLIFAIRRAGGAFKAAGGSLEELLALFTSVRATTRESAETIATGFRTIFTRMQRPKTIDFLRGVGIELQNLEGNFVGPFEAVKRLNQALKSLDSTDPRFAKIVEELGGFRQVSKVIPLIQQFGTAQQALRVAQQGQASLAKDAATAQQSLAIQIAKVREEFLGLFRDLAGSGTFKAISGVILGMASSFIKVADAIKPVLPLLGMMAAFSGAKMAFQFGSGFLGGLGGGGARGVGQNLGSGAGGAKSQAQSQAMTKLTTALTANTSSIQSNSSAIQKLSSAMIALPKQIRLSLPMSGKGRRPFATGGIVPGTGNRDTVPAMLTPGEFVIRKSSVEKYGAENIARMNMGGKIGDVSRKRRFGPGAKSYANRRSERFGQRARGDRRAYVFDFDDTLAVSGAVEKPGTADPFEDFRGQRAAGFIRSAQATKVAAMARSRASRGHDVHVLTARPGDRDTRSSIGHFMRGIGVPAKSVIGTAGMPGPGGTAGKKAAVLSKLRGQYGRIVFLDDNVENVLAAGKVKGVKSIRAKGFNEGGFARLGRGSIRGERQRQLDTALAQGRSKDMKILKTDKQTKVASGKNKIMSAFGAAETAALGMADKDSYGGAFMVTPGTSESFLGTNQTFGPLIKKGKGYQSYLQKKKFLSPDLKALADSKEKGIFEKYRTKNKYAMHAGALLPGVSEKIEDTLLNGVNRTVHRAARNINSEAGANTDVSSIAAAMKSANIDQTMGNLFENVLMAAGTPFDPKDGDAANAAFDFPKGLGSRKKSFAMPGAKGNIPVDAKTRFTRPNMRSLISKVENYNIKEAERELGTVFQGMASRLPAAATGRASGGGISGSDTVPALLTPGEFVINKSSAQRIGVNNLNSMNKGRMQGFASGGHVKKFAKGGSAGGGGGAGMGLMMAPMALQMLVDTLGVTNEGFLSLVSTINTVMMSMSMMSMMGMDLKNPLKSLKKGAIGAQRGLGKLIGKGGAKKLFVNLAKPFGLITKSAMGAVGAFMAVGGVLKIFGDKMQSSAIEAAEKATSAREERDAREKHKLGGTMSGAGTGAMAGVAIGMFAGPVGAVIGGAVGVAIGSILGPDMKAIEAAIERGRQARYLKQMSDSLASIEKDGLKDANLRDFIRGLEGSSGQAIRGRTEENREQFGTDFDKNLPKVRGVIDKLAETSTSIEDFESKMGGLGGRLLESIKLTDPALYAKLRQELVEQINVQNKLREAKEAEIEASKAARNLVTELHSFRDVLGRVNDSLSFMKNKFDDASASFEGKGKATFGGQGIQTGIFGKVMSGQNVDMKVFEEAVGQVAPNDAVRQEGVAVGNLMTKLPSILQDAALKAQTGGGDDKIGKEFEKAAAGQGISGKMVEQIAAQLQTMAGQRNKSEGSLFGDIRADAQGFAQKLQSESMKALIKGFQEVSKIIQDTMNNLSAMRERIIQTELSISNQRLAILSKIAKLDELRSKRGRARLGPAEGRDSFLAEQRVVLGEGQGPRDFSNLAGDTGGMGAELQRLEEGIRNTQKKINEASAKGDFATVAKLTGELGNMNSGVRKVTAALKLQASSTHELVKAQKDLKQAQFKTDTMARMAFATQEERMQFSGNVAAATDIVTNPGAVTQNMDQMGDQAATAYQGGLGFLQDLQQQGFTEFAGQNIQDSVDRVTVDQMVNMSSGMVGSQDAATLQAFGAEGDTLTEADIRDFYQSQIDARNDAGKREEEAIQNQIDAMVQLQLALDRKREQEIKSEADAKEAAAKQVEIAKQDAAQTAAQKEKSETEKKLGEEKEKADAQKDLGEFGVGSSEQAQKFTGTRDEFSDIAESDKIIKGNKDLMDIFGIAGMKDGGLVGKGKGGKIDLSKDFVNMTKELERMAETGASPDDMQKFVQGFLADSGANVNKEEMTVIMSHLQDFLRAGPSSRGALTSDKIVTNIIQGVGQVIKKRAPGEMDAREKRDKAIGRISSQTGMSRAEIEKIAKEDPEKFFELIRKAGTGAFGEAATNVETLTAQLNSLNTTIANIGTTIDNIREGRPTTSGGGGFGSSGESGERADDVFIPAGGTGEGIPEIGSGRRGPSSFGSRPDRGSVGERADDVFIPAGGTGERLGIPQMGSGIVGTSEGQVPMSGNLMQDANTLQQPGFSGFQPEPMGFGSEFYQKMYDKYISQGQSPENAHMMATAAEAAKNNTDGFPQLSSGGKFGANSGASAGALSKGTDTRLAALTPGEFVVNRMSAAKNLGLLQAINNSNVSFASKGGRIGYFQNGTPGGGAAFSQFASAVQLFSQAVSNISMSGQGGGMDATSLSSLSTALTNFPTSAGVQGLIGALNKFTDTFGSNSITVSMESDGVDVNLNGVEAFADLAEGSMMEKVGQVITAKFQDLFQGQNS